MAEYILLVSKENNFFKGEKMSVELLQQQWSEVTLIKIFEVEVLNKDKERDWIVFDIRESSDGLIAVPSEDLGVESPEVEWDDCFSLDGHLESLRECCSGAIQESEEWEEFYE